MFQNEEWLTHKHTNVYNLNREREREGGKEREEGGDYEWMHEYIFSPGRILKRGTIASLS